MSIPIITSNLDYYSINQQQSNEFDMRQNQSLLARPKQQQHKNLDKLVANLKNSKRIHLNQHSSGDYQSPLAHRSVKLKFNDDLGDDDILDENRNRLLTLSATDSICTTPQKAKHRHNHHHHHHHSSRHQRQSSSIETPTYEKNSSKSFARAYKNSNYMNSLPSNSNKSPNLVRRAVSSANRRQLYAQAQSRSLEYALDDSLSSEDEQPIEFSQEIMEAADKVTYITNHIKSENYYEEVNLKKKEKKIKKGF